MKTFELDKSLICFSDANDGDLSFYNFSGAEVEKRWFSLPIVKERALQSPKFLNQVHGAEIRLIRGHCEGFSPNADGLLTDQIDLPIGVFSADCLPVLISSKHCIGAVHAGWRSSKLNICGKAIELMKSEYGVSADEISAFIGPCINECCFELGDEVYREFIEADSHYSKFFTKKQKWHLSLRALNRYQLQKAGVLGSNIQDINECTFCNSSDYFSFRRQQKRNGSMFSFIVKR